MNTYFVRRIIRSRVERPININSGPSQAFSNFVMPFGRSDYEELVGQKNSYFEEPELKT